MTQGGLKRPASQVTPKNDAAVGRNAPDKRILFRKRSVPEQQRSDSEGL
jgi:hypothetical protein